jgi:ribosomal protein S18 acetylase RimI-like enzyme
VIRIAVDPFPDACELDELWQATWGASSGDYATRVLPRSLAHLAARDGERLIGFVNLAWDGGIHCFLLDICVDPDFRRRGIGTDLMRQATAVAKERGATWLHVDFEPHLEPLYRAAGFRPTAAGLINLTE